MNNDSHVCERRTLSQSSAAQIEACACGIIHITLGAVTLRFHPEAARSLCLTLNEALAQIGALEEAHLSGIPLNPGSPRGSA